LIAGYKLLNSLINQAFTEKAPIFVSLFLKKAREQDVSFWQSDIGAHENQLEQD
jgi:hypothetical protein